MVDNDLSGWWRISLRFTTTLAVFGDGMVRYRVDATLLLFTMITVTLDDKHKSRYAWTSTVRLSARRDEAWHMRCIFSKTLPAANPRPAGDKFVRWRARSSSFGPKRKKISLKSNPVKHEKYHPTVERLPPTPAVALSICPSKCVTTL